MYFGGHERDVLDIRLHELADVVDYFYILEGDRTFQGDPHEPQLMLDIERQGLGEFLPRIKYFIVSDWPSLPTGSFADNPSTGHDSRGTIYPINNTLRGAVANQNEIHLRNAITRYLEDFPGDTSVILADIDEIPRASAIPLDLSSHEFHRFGGPHYNYWINLRVSGGFQWFGARMCQLQELRSTTAENLRQYRGEGGIGGRPGDLYNAEWHFSFCGGGIETIKRKLLAWRHPEFINEETMNEEFLAYCIKEGKDWWSKRDLPFEWCEIDDSYPLYLREHLDSKFTHLVGKVASNVS
jgi:beta-1,4-mannosyl-glycoprotein beta-1,4-N-acetylglucosaminyltransferase